MPRRCAGADVQLPRDRTPKGDRPETVNQAQHWESVKKHYLDIGLCHICAAQAAWGHQLGWGYRASRPWPAADRRIKPPCAKCAPVVATVPKQTTDDNWRCLQIRPGGPGMTAEVPHAIPGQG